MGATVPASPILRKPRQAGFSQTPIVSEAMPAYVAPQQELAPMPTMTGEPAMQPALAPSPAQQPVAAFRKMALRRRGNRNGIQEL